MKYPEQINRLNDVLQLFAALHDAGISFHPDDSLTDIITGETGEPFFTKQRADELDLLMDKAFEICEKRQVSIYTIAIWDYKKRFIELFFVSK